MPRTDQDREFRKPRLQRRLVAQQLAELLAARGELGVVQPGDHRRRHTATNARDDLRHRRLLRSGHRLLGRQFETRHGGSSWKPL